MKSPPFRIPEGFEVTNLRVHEPEFPAWSLQFESEHDLRIIVEEREPGTYTFDGLCLEPHWVKDLCFRVYEWEINLETVEELLFKVAETAINTKCRKDAR